MPRVSMGPGRGRIIDVDSDAIRIIDEDKEELRVDLLECRRRMARSLGKAEEGCAYVGWRKLDREPWEVSLAIDPPVLLRFASYDAAYEELLIPLQRHGLRTLDLT